MNEILTIVEHAEIIVSKIRDIEHNTISQEDRNLLFDIVYKDKKSKERYIFSHCGGNKIKASSIVGSVSLKNGLTVEILPKFAKGHLTEESKKRHRKTLLNMVRVSNEKNFITSHAQSSKIPMEEMPLINYVIELFSSSLLSSLRQGLYSEYTKVVNNSSYVRGNILIAKTIQNNFIDKSKVYTSYNKHSTNNLLMQTFRTLAKMLLEDENLSYRTKQNLHEIYLLLDGVDIINLKAEDFQKVVFNRLNDKFEVLHNQASFIFKKYMPFSSHINATPFWSILFDMDYLFEKFVACLFRKSNIDYKEQNTKKCFEFKHKPVSIKPDFEIENKNRGIISVVDAKWKLLSNEKSLYGLNSQNFWQLFSYMNLINPNKEINGYFIVPKNNDEFEDEMIFEPIIENNKSIKILSIDFSLEFSELVNRYRFYILDGELQIKQLIVKKEIEIEKISEFNFGQFIDELDILSKNKNLMKALMKNYKIGEQFKNIVFLKDEQDVNTKQFKNFIRDNIKRTSLVLDDLYIEHIPKNINKLRFLTSLDLSKNKISIIPEEFYSLKKLKKLSIEKNKIYNINSNIKELINLEVFKIYGNTSLKISTKILELKNLKKVIVDKNIIEMNIDLFKELIENHVEVLDENDIGLYDYIKEFKTEELIKCTSYSNSSKIKGCGEFKSKESFKRLHSNNNYKTGICADCVNLNTRERSKNTEPILRDRYLSLKEKSENDKKKLSFAVEEFVKKYSSDEVFIKLYNEWNDIELNKKRNKDLKPNFYFINEKLDYDLNNIDVAISKEVDEINRKRNPYPAHAVVQFEKDDTPIKIFNSVDEAKNYVGLIGNAGIYNCCTGKAEISAEHKWKYKKDVSKDIIDYLESKENNQTKLLNETNNNEYQNKEETEKNLKENDDTLMELLIEFRDNEISKEFDIDDTCILSPVMIDELIKHKPYDGKNEFALKTSRRLRENINIEQMKYIDKIFEILEIADE